MINVVSLGGPNTRVQASLVGQEVVVLAYVCPTRAVQRGVFHELVRQIARRELTPPPAPEPEAIAEDEFAPGVKVSVSIYDWDAGSRRIDATVARRISDELLELRTRFGQVMTVQQVRVRLGWSAH